MPEAVQFIYLTSLLAVLGCLALLDRRFKLAFWQDRRAATLTLVIGIAIFVAWDICGINLDIFSHGASQYMLPIRLYPEFALEELLFLTLLCYQTLLLWRGTLRYLDRQDNK